MRLWVTRPALDAASLRAKLIAQGHEVIVEPLLLIDFKDIPALEFDNVQALIATSRNGIRAIAATGHVQAIRQIRLFAVGSGTGATAKELGFHEIIEGPSTAENLLPVIRAHADIDGGALLHLAGTHLAFDLAGKLRQIGYNVLQHTVYAARAVCQLPAALLSQIVTGDIDGVVLLSPRTAQTYADLIRAYQIEHAIHRLVHFCLSPSVADRLSQIQIDDVRIPQRPSIHGMIALTGQTTASF
ncbi:MAG: uroporphyrinogen-III synthase [Pseudomonadota bacterium]